MSSICERCGVETNSRRANQHTDWEYVCLWCYAALTPQPDGRDAPPVREVRGDAV